MSKIDLASPNPVAAGRLHMPAIETVAPAGEIDHKIRKEDQVKIAFGLENDAAHWSNMKADALEICLAELPPSTLPMSMKEALGLGKTAFLNLQFRIEVDAVKNYLWEYALRSWRNKYDYDIQYMQKRYPDGCAKSIICGYITKLNSKANKNPARRYAAGRNLKQIYADLTKSETKAASSVANIAQDHLQKPTYQDQPTDPSPADAEVHTPHRSEPLKRNSDVYWPNVVLDIQHLDQVEEPLDCLAFSFICGPNPCAPGNVQMDIIKNDLKAQNVNADDFYLRLKGSEKDIGWELRNMCLALTLWCRSRADDDFDVPLLLVPRLPPESVTHAHDGKTTLAAGMEATPFVQHESIWDIEAGDTQSLKRDSIDCALREYGSSTVIRSYGQVHSGVKRDAVEMQTDGVEVPGIAQDPRLAKRMRKEAKAAKWQQG